MLVIERRTSLVWRDNSMPLPNTSPAMSPMRWR